MPDAAHELFHKIIAILISDGYRKVNRSQIPVLAPIDLEIIAECILIGETSRLDKAVERFRSAHPIVNR